MLVAVSLGAGLGRICQWQERKGGLLKGGLQAVAHRGVTSRASQRLPLRRGGDGRTGTRSRETVGTGRRTALGRPFGILYARGWGVAVGGKAQWAVDSPPEQVCSQSRQGLAHRRKAPSRN